MKNEKFDSPELENLRKEINSINERLLRIEASMNRLSLKDSQTVKDISIQSEEEFEINLPFQSKGSIEFRVGEYGMAWLGNIVLLFGITFLIQYLHKSGNSFLSFLIGIFSISAIYVGSFFLKNTTSYLSKLLTYSAHLLLFYLVLRLHYVQENPLIQSPVFGLVLLCIVLGILFVLSVRKKSQLMSGLILAMMIVAGIISNSSHFLLGITSLTAVLSIVLFYRFSWINLVILFILFTYFTLFLWILNNPFVTGELIFRETNNFGYIYLILNGFIFSALAILPKKENISEEIIIGTIVWNGLGFSSLIALTVFACFPDNYIFLFAAIMLFCFIYAVILQSKSFLKITAALYAIYGFISMSIVIYGIYNFPKAYLLLSIQSFLVVTAALWFRSRFLVIMNTLLFLALMIFYIKDPVSFNSTNFSFMMVAFITARVMNWKKERLTLKTEFIRNIYLMAGFIMTLIAFYHAVPESFVTVSWIGSALIFFLLSQLINNIKYRWLAIAAMIASAIHLIFIDMSKMNILYRILVFLLLSIISISVSIVYTRYFSNRK